MKLSELLSRRVSARDILIGEETLLTALDKWPKFLERHGSPKVLMAPSYATMGAVLPHGGYSYRVYASIEVEGRQVNLFFYNTWRSDRNAQHAEWLTTTHSTRHLLRKARLTTGT